MGGEMMEKITFTIIEVPFYFDNQPCWVILNDVGKRYPGTSMYSRLYTAYKRVLKLQGNVKLGIKR